MPQFTVYRNPNPESKARIPYLLDVQSDLLADLSTRVVAPLARASGMKGHAIKSLMPTFEIEGEYVVMLTPQLAGVAGKVLGEPVANLIEHRADIVAALDLLITGI
ncbi:MAG: CcdB family protein [Burkholderiales bacterium]|nr:CcdB family protein [Burkholderiales bacterium]